MDFEILSADDENELRSFVITIDKVVSLLFVGDGLEVSVKIEMSLIFLIIGIMILDWIASLRELMKLHTS